jgi:predicted site-specific integrase-resolvase
MQDGSWVSDQKACKFFGVSANTLRRWANNNQVEHKRTPSNYRIYYIPVSHSYTNKDNIHTKNTIKQNYIYCRVSSHKQTDDLDRQSKFLQNKYPGYILVTDIGSGLNYKRKGLLRLLEYSNKGLVNQVVVYSKDRLCRFGFELIEWQFLQNNTTLLVYEQTNKTPEEEFTEDILAILQVFACRWNGKRKYNSSTIKKDQNNKITNCSKTKITRME